MPSQINVAWSNSNPAAEAGKRLAKIQQTGTDPVIRSIEFDNLGGVDYRTTTTETIDIASFGMCVAFANAAAIAVTLDTAAVPAHFMCAVRKDGAGTPTLTPSSGTINGEASVDLTADGWLFFDGTNWRFLAGGGGSAAPSGTGIVTVTDGAFDDPVALTLDTDGTLAADSDDKVATQKAVKTYADSLGSFPGGGTSIYPKLTKPLTANFSFLNPNSYAAAATDKSDRLLITVPPSSSGLAFMQTASLPATPYTIDLGVAQHAGAVSLAGIALKNSGGNALRTYSFRLNSPGTFLYTSDQSWTSVTAPGTENGTTGANLLSGALLFIRITDDGASRLIYSSFDGKDYQILWSQTHTTGVTPDSVGIVLYNANASVTQIVKVYHWIVSTSVLPQYAA